MAGGEFTIVIDSREQKPYKFTNAVVKGLKTGDYSIEGLESRVAIERKSKADAYGSLSTGRKRFEREVERLSDMDYGAILVESSLKGFMIPPKYSKMNPKHAVSSLVSWSVKYKRLPIFFCENRIYGRALVLKLLSKFWKYHVDT